MAFLLIVRYFRQTPIFSRAFTPSLIGPGRRGFGGVAEVAVSEKRCNFET